MTNTNSAAGRSGSATTIAVPSGAQGVGLARKTGTFTPAVSLSITIRAIRTPAGRPGFRPGAASASTSLRSFGDSRLRVGPVGGAARAATGSTPGFRRRRTATGHDRPHGQPGCRRGARADATAARPLSWTGPHRSCRPVPAHLELGFDQPDKVPARQQALGAGITRVSEMKDRSAVTSSGAGATCSGRSWRTLTRSSTVTLGSLRRDQASWPYPTSTATTWAAPARSSTSVKPPVEAPASRQRRPATVSPVKAASAPCSLFPPRDAYSGPDARSSTVIAASWPTWVAGLPAAWP